MYVFFFASMRGSNFICTHSTSVGAGKFLGVRKIFARISPNLLKVLMQLCVSISSHRDHFVMTSKKGSSCDSSHVGRQFLKMKQR